MGIIQRVKTLFAKRTISESEYLRKLIATTPSRSGVSVTDENVWSYTPFYSAVNLIADSVSYLPLPIYENINNGREKRNENPVYSLLNTQANSYQSAFVFRHLLTTWAVGYGNGYAEIQRDNIGRAVAIWPIPPSKVTPKVKVVNGQTLSLYDIQLPNGGEATLLGENVLHIQGFSVNGLEGMGIIKTFRETIGLGLATEAYGNMYFSNRAAPAGAIKHPGKLSDAAVKHLRESWESLHSGLDNAHRIAFLEEGSEYINLSNDNESSQMLETRKFGIDEISRVFRIPKHLLGSDSSSGTYQNIEQANLFYLQFCLMPWLRRWESESNRKLLMPSEQARLYAEHNVDALLRADTLTRYQAYNIGYSKWLSTNDIRRKENMEIIENGELAEMPKVAAPSAVAPTTPTETQRALIIMTHKDLFKDVCGRIIRRESGAITKTYKDNKPIDSVLNEQRQFMNETLSPVVHTLLAALGSSRTFSANKEITEFIDKYIQTTADTLHKEGINRGSVLSDNQERINDLVNQIINHWGNE